MPEPDSVEEIRRADLIPSRAAIAGRAIGIWVRCPACRTVNALADARPASQCGGNDALS
jgi:hypothetical protein